MTTIQKPFKVDVLAKDQDMKIVEPPCTSYIVASLMLGRLYTVGFKEGCTNTTFKDRTQLLIQFLDLPIPKDDTLLGHVTTFSKQNNKVL